MPCYTSVNVERRDNMGGGYMTTSKRLLQWVVRGYLEHLFDIEIKGNVTKQLKAPYLIIGNHQNNWDGFIMNSYIDQPISFVVSDEQFRTPIMRKLLGIINAIPTIKAKNDITTIKRILKAKKENRIIGLYPEGNRTWDGTTEPIYFSTAKLIKSLAIPVVFTSFKGGHLAHPRWAKHPRKGKIFVSYDLLLTEEQIKELTVDEIYEILFKALDHDEFLFQSEMMLTYKGKKLAEKLENLLFACPNCHEHGQLQSSNNVLFCKSCDYSVEYTQYGTLISSKKLYFTNTRDWNRWQLEQLNNILKEGDKIKGQDEIIADDNIILKQGERYKPLKKVSIGRIAITNISFIYKPTEGELITIPIDQMDGLNLQVKNQLDFYYKNELYRLSFKKSKASPYKWFKVLEILQKDLLAKRKKQV